MLLGKFSVLYSWNCHNSRCRVKLCRQFIYCTSIVIVPNTKDQDLPLFMSLCNSRNFASLNFQIHRSTVSSYRLIQAPSLGPVRISCSVSLTKSRRIPESIRHVSHTAFEISFSTPPKKSQSSEISLQRRSFIFPTSPRLIDFQFPSN